MVLTGRCDGASVPSGVCCACAIPGCQVETGGGGDGDGGGGGGNGGDGGGRGTRRGETGGESNGGSKIDR
jgi:hypothetical protein